MKQGTRHVTRRAFLASMAALGAVVPFARPSNSTAAVTPLTKAIPIVNTTSLRTALRWSLFEWAIRGEGCGIDYRVRFGGHTCIW